MAKNKITENVELIKQLQESTDCEPVRAMETLNMCDWDLKLAEKIIKEEDERDMTELPYEFDLYFDIKYKYQVHEYIKNAKDMAKNLAMLEEMLKEYNIEANGEDNVSK